MKDYEVQAMFANGLCQRLMMVSEIASDGVSFWGRDIDGTYRNATAFQIITPNAVHVVPAREMNEFLKAYEALGPDAIEVIVDCRIDRLMDSALEGKSLDEIIRMKVDPEFKSLEALSETYKNNYYKFVYPKVQQLQKFQQSQNNQPVPTKGLAL